MADDEWAFALYHAAEPVETLWDARERKATWRLAGPGEASFVLDHRSPRAKLIQELVTDLVVLRRGEPWWRGTIGPSTDEFGTRAERGDKVEFSAVDYRGRLERRLTWAEISWAAMAPSDMAWDLVAQAQAIGPGTSAHLGITRGDTYPMAPRTLDVAWGVSIAAGIDSLAAQHPGFDWWTDGHRRLHTGWRGSSRTWPLRYGETVSGGQRNFDPTLYSNVVRASGADGVTPALAVVGDLAARPEGRWESQIGDTDLAAFAAVQALAERELSRRATVAAEYDLDITPGAWTPDDAWIGDGVPVQIRTGRLDVDTIDRITEITIDLDATPGVPKATIACGSDLARNLAQLLRSLPEQITQLTRR